MPLDADFAHPPTHLHSRPLWFWNGRLTRGEIERQLEGCQASGYAGVGILPAKGLYPPFMSREFLDLYRAAADKAAVLGLKLCLYDEFWFPSGSAGGRLAEKYPDALWKRLDLLAVEVEGPSRVRLELPRGTPMGAVAMRLPTLERLDLADAVRDGILAWSVPAGTWKVMLFTCVTEIRGLCPPYPDHLVPGGLVDYLDPDAVGRFIEVTYQAYHDAMPEHFGTTVDSAFYDEPTAWYRLDGRGWTPRFNERFRARHGFDPAPLYPALWFDIGPDTTAARNLLFGFRAELYSTGFPKVVAAWCRAHGLQLTGHLDQEEAVNPVGQSGDLMKALKYQDIPGVDEIVHHGRAARAYKIVSSAAYNYDHPLVMTETCGAMADMPVAMLYKEAMDQAAKGINLFVPHAVWYDKEHVIFPPELSADNSTYGPHLPAYNEYVGRLHRLLQGGRHVADIGVLYPIATLQAGHRFGDFDHYRGEPVPPEADYMDVGEWLALAVRRDYTFVHPETLAERCTVEGATLHLDNAVNWETYRVFILPGSAAISVETLRKVAAFHAAGGQVIATTCLPTQSAELGQGEEVRRLVAEIFGSPEVNARGGRAVFIPHPGADALAQVLAEMLPVPDVAIETAFRPEDGNLSYIHKVLEDRHVYFFANSSDVAVSMQVRLRGRLEPQTWNPQTGKLAPLAHEHAAAGAGEVARVGLELGPVESLFVVAPVV